MELHVAKIDWIATTVSQRVKPPSQELLEFLVLIAHNEVGPKQEELSSHTTDSKSEDKRRAFTSWVKIAL